MFPAEKGLHWFPYGQLLNCKIIPLTWPMIWEDSGMDLKSLGVLLDNIYVAKKKKKKDGSIHLDPAVRPSI